MDLKEFFTKNNEVALCFSGGADSSYLLYAGLKFGAKVQPYYLKTEFQPLFEFEDAKRLCDELGVNLIVKNMSVFDNSDIIKNDKLRCYYCKQNGLGTLYEMAKADGFNVVIDGSNIDDNPSERPGMQALLEIGILSPLRECKLTKTEIRRLSKEAGLFTWNKMAYACLATRIQTGDIIEKDILKKVENSEKKLFEMGFYDFRVRVLGKYAKLELPADGMQKALDKREELIKNIDFDEVLLDLKPR